MLINLHEKLFLFKVKYIRFNVFSQNQNFSKDEGSEIKSFDYSWKPKGACVLWIRPFIVGGGFLTTSSPPAEKPPPKAAFTEFENWAFWQEGIKVKILQSKQPKGLLNSW